MRLALSIFPTAETPPPAALGRLAEERGFEALLFPEHTHIPASRESPHPAGIDLPEEYARILDPFVASLAAAAATTTLRVGTAICLIGQRDPIVTAKEVASIDVVTGGRFELGVGAGWNVEEMVNHGVDPDHRFRRMREAVEAMTAIWTADEASYAGEHFAFERIWSWPKPVQRPRPPVLLGGNGAGAVQRALRWADTWMPNTAREADGGDDALVARIAELKARAERPIGVTLSSSPLKPQRLERYRDAGVDRFLFYLPSAGPDAIEERLEAIEASAAHLG